MRETTAGNNPNDQPQITGRRFPEKVEYIIGPAEALRVMEGALEAIKTYRKDRLYIFKTVVGPLVPESIRDKLEKLHLEDMSVSYDALINGMGNIFSALVVFNLEETSESVQENYRFIVLPYLELKFRRKIKQLEREKPFGWRIIRKFYQSNLNDISPLVDNLINLVALAWTFCPAIGEPEQETGFFNRFVFTSNGGFIDLGHFFNCSMVAYLYGVEQADRRAEATEITQEALRKKRWLVKLRQRNYLRLITNLLWGYATSANTIEDRASDKLGIMLGTHVRNAGDNAKLIEYYIRLYQKMIKRSIKLFHRPSKFRRLLDMVIFFFKNLFYTAHQSIRFDIKKYMENFFDEYDAVDPADTPPDLFADIVAFYTEKYGGDEWEKYTCKEWQAVIPQDIYEQVVKGREKFQPKQLPVKIQQKETGELVDPY